MPLGTTRSSQWIWLLAALALSLPSIAFVVAHGLYGALHLSPERRLGVLEPVLYWTMAATGVIGAVLTVTAIIVTVVATFIRTVPRRTTVIMWLFACASVLACVYGSQVRP